LNPSNRGAPGGSTGPIGGFRPGSMDAYRDWFAVELICRRLPSTGSQIATSTYYASGKASVTDTAIETARRQHTDGAARGQRGSIRSASSGTWPGGRTGRRPRPGCGANRNRSDYWSRPWPVPNPRHAARARATASRRGQTWLESPDRPVSCGMSTWILG
jgi:hypothetical protein